MIPLAIVAGFVAGLVIAGLASAAENSRIAFGNYALYGNGALIVPVILAPFALYPGWVWLLAHEGDRRLEAAVYALGLSLGVGVPGMLATVQYAQSTDVPLLIAVPGSLLIGTLFVVPAALLCAATLWLVRSGRVAINPLTAAFSIVIAALSVPAFGAGLGILSGGAIALALERPARRTTIGILLLVLVIVVGNAPIVFFALLTPSSPAP